LPVNGLLVSQRMSSAAVDELVSMRAGLRALCVHCVCTALGETADRMRTAHALQVRAARARACVHAAALAHSLVRACVRVCVCL
jgi:hypothetical protein